IEPSLGVDRLMLAMLLDAYKEEELEDGSERVVLQLHPSVAAYKAAVFPLTKKLNEEAEEVFHELSKYFNVDYDDSGSIGKRYRRHDEIGTPFCITYDFDSLDDKCVTVRDRDTMEQKRVKIDELKEYIENIIKL
ncbi:MAG TPA: glycine--tRNA ligase, partial [Clostridiales bacterium]|nr:glycine--tRNA ligase [Clostridiales bacterium]